MAETQADKLRRHVSRHRGKLRNQRERPMVRDLRRFFKDIRTTVDNRLTALGRIPAIDELFRPSQFGDAFGRTIIPHLSRSIFIGIKAEYDLIEAFKLEDDQSIRQADGPDEPPEPHDIELPLGILVPITWTTRRLISRFLQERNVAVWKKVGPTVRKKLDAEILKAIKDGDKFPVLERRLKKVLRGIQHVHPLVIAETEIGHAINYGSQVEREELGIEWKEWLSVLDARNRGANPGRFDHMAPNRQIRPNNEPFDVSGEQLMYPLDASLGASAGNRISCRCDAIVSVNSLLGHPPGSRP